MRNKHSFHDCCVPKKFYPIREDNGMPILVWDKKFLGATIIGGNIVDTRYYYINVILSNRV